MENSETKLTPLQFRILNGLADDYEDVEQLYLYANRDVAEVEHSDVRSPLVSVQIRFPLRDIVDEISNMLRLGYIVAKYSNDEKLAPLHSPNVGALHHYWFAASDKGTQYWKAQARNEEPHG